MACLVRDISLLFSPIMMKFGSSHHQMMHLSDDTNLDCLFKTIDHGYLFPRLLNQTQSNRICISKILVALGRSNNKSDEL